MGFANKFEIELEFNCESFEIYVKNETLHALQLTATAVRDASYPSHPTPRAAGRRDATTRPLLRLTPVDSLHCPRAEDGSMVSILPATLWISFFDTLNKNLFFFFRIMRLCVRNLLWDMNFSRPLL
jgi:hypothetical protein